MKPVSWIFLIIAVIMVIIGLLMCSIATLQARRQGVELYDTEIENGHSLYRYDFTEDVIGKIQIEVNNCNVNIYCSAEKNEVEMRNFASAGFICEVENRALVIEDTINLFNLTDIIENGKIRFKGFRYYLRDRRLAGGQKTLDIYITDKFDIKVFDIKVNNGDINLVGYENNTDYNFDITNGKLTASNIYTVSEVKATVGDGSVDLFNVKAKTVNVSLEKGNISAVLSANEIIANTKSGNVNIDCAENLEDYSFELEAPDGEVTLAGIKYPLRANYQDALKENYIHAHADGGNIRVEKYTAPIIPPDYNGATADTDEATEEETTDAATLPSYFTTEAAE